MTRRSLVAGAAIVTVAGGLGSWFAGAADPARMLHAWLGAFVFAISLAVGALTMVMIGHVVAIRWFVVIRPVAEAVMGTVPALAVLGLPLAIGARDVYPWARGEPEHPGWLEPEAVLVRAVVHLAIWTVLAEVLRATGSPARRRAVSAAGLPILAFSGSFAVFDWLMSSVPGWASNVLGLYVLTAGWGAAVALVAALLPGAKRGGLVPAEVGPAHAHALGRLVLVGVCLWAYLAMAALVIVWSADLPREAAFFVHRGTSPWGWVTAVVIAGRFVVPFFVLLSREAKRREGFLAAFSCGLVLMHALDGYWLAMPDVAEGPRLFDALPFAAVSGFLVLVAALRSIPASHTVATPDRERSLAYESP